MYMYIYTYLYLLSFNYIIFILIIVFLFIHVYSGGVDRLIRVEDLKSGMARDQVEVFRLLNIHLTNEVEGSAYNWVRPSLWTAVFGRLVTTKTN